MEISVTFLDNLNAQESLRVDKLLGQGKFQVFQVYCKTRKANFALKVFPAGRIGTLLYNKEKKFSKLSHPNLIETISVITHENRFHIQLLELIKHGDFFDAIQDRFLSNNCVLMRTYFQQLVRGVEYMHSQGVAHLDLKLENLMFGNKFQLKIIDFDGSESLESQATTGRGTPDYRAPELMNGNCKDFAAADIYSMGVILYIFKTGEMPFEEEKGEKINPRSLNGKFRSDKQAFWNEKSLRFGSGFFSKEFIELIDGMLECDPQKRFKMQDVKFSRWFQGTVLGEDELMKTIKPQWKEAQAKKEKQAMLDL